MERDSGLELGTLKTISVAGVTYKLPDRSISSTILPSEREMLATLLEEIGEVSADEQSLPEELYLDGVLYDTQQLRSWIAVGLTESISWVSDKDVLELIVKGGLGTSAENLLPENILDQWPKVVEFVGKRLKGPAVKSEASRLQSLYVGRRGLMVIDVVASRQRNYKVGVEGRILPAYQGQSADLSLRHLAKTVPSFLRVRTGEAETMSELASFILRFSKSKDEEEVVRQFAESSHRLGVRSEAIAIKGIGPVLFEYLRMLSGVDTLKVDSRVRQALRSAGLPQQLFSDHGLLEVCKALAGRLGCSLVELDQALWLRDG